MKKYNLIKVIAITVFVMWVLTLIIPSSSFDYSGAIKTTTIASSGLWGLFSNLGISISYFNGIAIFVIAIACFYAVLGKTKTYNSFVNKVADMFNGKQRKLVIISTLFFGITSLFVNEFITLLVFVPFVYSVMKNVKVDNKVILSSTIVASIIGSMCGIYNSTLFSLLKIEINTLLLVKIIVFVVSIVILLIFTAPKNNNKIALEVKENSKTDDLEKKVETKKAEVKKTEVKKTSTAKTTAKKKTTKSQTAKKEVAKKKTTKATKAGKGA